MTLSLDNSHLQRQLDALGGTKTAELLEVNTELEQLLKVKDAQLRDRDERIAEMSLKVSE